MPVTKAKQLDCLQDAIRYTPAGLVTEMVVKDYLDSWQFPTTPECPACPVGSAKHVTDILKPSTWAHEYAKFIVFLTTGIPQFSIFVKGNSKLPFWGFSSLPGSVGGFLFCPGAGDCLGWCYSFKAWRYPAAYFRQLQNHILLQSEMGRAYIATALLKLQRDSTVRLYVDGDFPNVDIMQFWFDIIKLRQDLSVYGYSKSWQVFLDYAKRDTFPENYILNLSSGSKYGESVRLKMLELTTPQGLPVVRDDFLAVPAPFKMPDKRNNPSKWAEFAKAVKAYAKSIGYANGFVCPGKCGDCLPNGKHACGTRAMQGVPVLIGIH